MNFYRPIHYIFGEAVFEIDSKDFPRFSSLLAEKRLGFWGSRPQNGKISFHSSVFASDSIIDLANESGIPLELLKKRGIPFIFARYRKRYGLFLGLALGLMLMLYSQLFVWKITVSGNKTIPASEIEKALAECGVAVGSFIPDIDVARDANRFLMICDSISSAAISINGTHATISVLEATPVPDIIDRGGYYNVVAERDGVILDIDAADGTAEVREGDIVYEGEILINSFIEGTNGTFRPTHARGAVYAAVNESFSIEIPFERVTKQYTGRTETKRAFYLLGRELPSISGVEAEYEYFDAVATEKQLKLFGFIELPIKEFCVVYSEYVPATEPITAETAEILAREALDDYLSAFESEVLSCETTLRTDEENGICKLFANAVIKQDIAKEIPFEIGSMPNP